MKVITIFSGKGGVGKSTISSLLALEISKKYKTCLLDFDINTPSIPVLFGERQKVKNLDLYSTGYENKGVLNFGSRSTKQILNDLAKNVKKKKYDFCIIDMPPSFTEVHNQVMTKLKPSGMICVTQPNNLSKEDTIRAVSMFMATKIPILGVIYNMSSETFGEDENIGKVLKKLFEVKLIDELSKKGNSGNIDKVKNPFENKIDEILNKLENVDWDLDSFCNKNNNFEGLDIDIVKGMFNNISSINLKDYRFMGLNSWDWIREELLELEIFQNQFLIENSKDKIKSLLNGFDDSGFGLFTIIKPPGTEIRTLAGEVGYGRLHSGEKDDSYYGVPRLKYQTEKGELTLFPHEVAPVNIDYVNQLVKEKELVKLDSVNERWIPTKKTMEEINNQFGLCPNWKEIYEELEIKNE